jgi:hypothetical protein
MTFSFSQSQHERIEIDVHGYERPVSGEYWDDNWLRTDIRVSTGKFRGEVYAAIITSELAAFLSELRTLHERLNGSAEFKTIEEQLSLRLVGDGRGHFELRGEVADQPGISNRLHFSLQFDQSQLGAAIRELEQVTSKFPVRAA